MPILPEAPARFSTTTDCPSSLAQASAIKRAVMSTLPPGAKGATSVVARWGKAWAEAEAAAMQPAVARTAPRTCREIDDAMRVSFGLRVWRSVGLLLSGQCIGQVCSYN